MFSFHCVAGVTIKRSVVKGILHCRRRSGGVKLPGDMNQLYFDDNQQVLREHLAPEVSEMLQSLRCFLGENDMMAYLTYDGQPPARTPPRPQTHRLVRPPLRPDRLALFKNRPR
jgi:hypothetical protein